MSSSKEAVQLYYGKAVVQGLSSIKEVAMLQNLQKQQCCFNIKKGRRL